MNVRIKIILGFSLIILLLSATGFLLIQSLQNLSSETKNIYEHPFAVSNATRNIQIYLSGTQSLLRDIALTQSDETFGTIQEKIRQNEIYIVKEFDLIRERFLGKAEKVEEAQQAFYQFNEVVDEIVNTRKSEGRAAISFLLENDVIQAGTQVDYKLGYLMDFATGKANEFYSKTLDAKRYSLLILTILLVVTIGASIFIMVNVVRNHDLTLNEMNRYFHLIDQNILTASITERGHFIQVSNALCRFLNCTQKEILGTECRFFMNEGQNPDLVDQIYNVIRTGFEWEGDIKRVLDNREVQWIKLHIHPVFDSSFAINSFNIILQDVTDKKTLEDMSVTDKLTNLHNRRYFDRVIEKEIRLAQRKDIYLSLAILDIDFFKNFNDNYGHPAGDEVLENVARVLKKCLNRPNDYCFRLGGEEFGIVFSDTDSKTTGTFLEKIREEIHSLQIKHEFSAVSEFLSVSIGAQVAKGLDIPQKRQFYIQADRALYQAKKDRNTVVVL